MEILVQLLPLLAMLVIFGIPIIFGVRWVTKRNQAVANIDSSEPPTREEFAAIVDQLESLSRRLEDLDERELFLERLLEKPHAGEQIEAARTCGGDGTA